MAKALIDTDVLIDHLRGYDKAKGYLQARQKARDTLYYSVISKAELFAGTRPGEERLLRALLASILEIAVDGPIAEEAGAYCRKFTKSHGLLLPDALIAASAKSVGATLVTLNTKHFPMKDITVIAPYR